MWKYNRKLPFRDLAIDVVIFLLQLVISVCKLKTVYKLNTFFQPTLILFPSVHVPCVLEHPQNEAQPDDFWVANLKRNT